MTTVLITGPESSGNRMLCRMMREAGADILHKPMPMTTHWRPSYNVPEEEWDGDWTDFSTLEWDAAVVVHRDINCTVKSQVERGHIRPEEAAIDRTRRALVNIYGQLAKTDKPWWPVTYESLARREAVVNLCDRLGLGGQQIKTTWRDANAKHYGGQAWEDHTPLWKRPTFEGVVDWDLGRPSSGG